jgi:DNA-binding CsgD family transcriptional regulator
MEQMTHAKNDSEPGSLPPAEMSVASRGRMRAWAPVALFGVIAAFIGTDVVGDMADGASLAHLAVELAVMACAVAGAGLMWQHLRAAQARALDLQRDLDGTRADLARWRAEAQGLLDGLGAAIDRQFDGWGLTPAEREVALLLLKGLSSKEIAEARSTSERTVRQQALAVYRKAGIAGRAELAAFFLEDLLLPSSKGARRTAGG